MTGKITDDALMVLSNTKRVGGIIHDYRFSILGDGRLYILGAIRDDDMHGSSRIFRTSPILSVSDGYVETHNTLYKLDRTCDEVHTN